MKNQQSNFYQTADLPCAAALSLFFSIEGINKSDPRRANFLFARTKTFEKVLAKYQRGGLMVEPRAYFDAIKSIKTRLYDSN